MIDMETPRPTLHQVGPKHAVTDYLRRMRNVTRTHITDEPDGWPEYAMKLTAGRMPRDAVARLRDCIEKGPHGTQVLNITQTETRSLGKPVTRMHVLRAWPAAAVWNTMPNLVKHHQEEWLIVQRDTVDVKTDRIDVRMDPYGFAISRHALERIHEREHCPTGGIDEEMRKRIVDLHPRLAVAYGMQLFIHPETPTSRITTIVPFGDGLAILERRSVASIDERIDSVGDVLRVTIRHGKSRMREEMHGALNVDRRVTQDKVATINHIWVVVTYVSVDMLRPGQLEYLKLTEELCTLVNPRSFAAVLWDTDGRMTQMRQRAAKSARVDFKGEGGEFEARRMVEVMRTMQQLLTRELPAQEGEPGIWSWAADG